MADHAVKLRGYPGTLTYYRYAPQTVDVWPTLVRAGAFGSVALIGLLANDWIAALGVLVLYAGWKLFARAGISPVITACLTIEWLQVMSAVVYFAVTGRVVEEMATSDYRPMVLIALGSLVALFGGFYLASRPVRAATIRQSVGTPLPFSTSQIAIGYAVALLVSGSLEKFAWSSSGFTQVLLVFSRIRYVFLFFLITRLVKGKANIPGMLAILLFEVALGFSGYFAEFREPLLVSAIAILGVMDRRKFSTWLMVAGIGFLGVGAAMLWTAIKPAVRKAYSYEATTSERLNSVFTVATNTFAPNQSNLAARTDTLVTRLWTIYYPALMLKRVPTVIPHENGAILEAAIENVVTPRLFNPNKPAIASPSDEVRNYAGVWVHGRESNTSIAFGFVGESYVDFGVPYMFVPIFLWGIALGLGYRWLSTKIRHVELRTGVMIVIFWTALGSYEASWVMMIGPAITIFAVLGSAAIFADRLLAAGKGAIEPVSVPFVMRLRSD